MCSTRTPAAPKSSRATSIERKAGKIIARKKKDDSRKLDRATGSVARRGEEKLLIERARARARTLYFSESVDLLRTRAFRRERFYSAHGNRVAALSLLRFNDSSGARATGLYSPATHFMTETAEANAHATFA